MIMPWYLRILFADTLMFVDISIIAVWSQILRDSYGRFRIFFIVPPLLSLFPLFLSCRSTSLRARLDRIVFRSFLSSLSRLFSPILLPSSHFSPPISLCVFISSSPHPRPFSLIVSPVFLTAYLWNDIRSCLRLFSALDVQQIADSAIVFNTI